jgi:hypothetical protein
MNTVKITILTLLMILLSACQSAPIVGSQDSQKCPSVAPVECPVCEVLQCPEPQVIERLVTEDVSAPERLRAADSSDNAARVIGAREWVKVEPSDFVFEARIDTGAETSSIHAEDIRLLEKDGKRYVQFSLQDPETGATIDVEQRLHRRILVKQNVEDSADRRYVVRMWLTLGDTRSWVDVSLTDRKEFDFPLLIGRNMLVDSFIVDVSKRHTLPKSYPVGE